MKSAFLGAGYISKFHYIDDLTDLIGVADLDQEKAASFHAKPVKTLDELIALKPDIIHVLTPAESHAKDGIKVLESGLNLFIEKPMSLSSQEAEKLLALAKEKGLKFGVNHNFLFYPIYEKLKVDLKNEELGPIDQVSITWFRELEMIKSGPFNNWIVQNAKNLIFEIGSHLAAIYIDLLGEPETLKVFASDPITLPSGVTIYRRIKILGFQGKTSGEINLSIRAGMNERKVEVRGLNGIATVDFDLNTYLLKKTSRYSLDLDRFFASRALAKALKKQALATFKNVIFSKLKLSKIKDPYSNSIERSVRAFYKTGSDPRQSPEFGVKVIRFCENAATLIPENKVEKTVYPPIRTKPKTLIFGASGFIGKALLDELKEPVRVFTRRPLHHPLVENMIGSLDNTEEIKRSLDGIETVVHLARAKVNSWNDYLNKEIKTNENLAKLLEKQGIKRLIYTGTIDSYYAGSGLIEDDTPLDSEIGSRNYYARAKALSEAAFSDLPFVILRPGIVIGKGASPFHFGIAKFSPNGTEAELWGTGKNKLPLVLAEDVAKAILLSISAKNIDKETFLLTSPPLLSALDYIEELEKAIHTKIKIIPKSPLNYYVQDIFKWLVKSLIHHPNRKTPSYRDWKSRTQQAVFCPSKAEKQLGWMPVKEKSSLIQKGIIEPVNEWLS